MGAALSEYQPRYTRPTATARQIRSPKHPEMMLVRRIPTVPGEVEVGDPGTEPRAAVLDSLDQHVTYRCGQPYHLRPHKSMRSSRRMKPGVPKRLININIPQARYDALIEQQWF